ncbi:class 2 aldolase adducin domain-containing protein [Apiospora kogelbergensis]|uniref:Class 2 aldolase adducin domain-containing protein n=1 Tax=Apiospora kogelbergensis TaxID=1337665 RepID=A0AAW0R8L3_9PEZI
MAPSAISELAPTVVPRTKKADEVEADATTAAQKEQTPLKAISHGAVMPGIPTFSSFTEHRKHMLVHMAATFRYFARHGFTEGQSGHISVRDPEHHGYMWMNPLGVHFGLLTAGHMICMEIETGKIVGGSKPPGALTANAAGYLIHSAIHKRRPGDIHAICHAHTDAGRAWSVFARPLDMLSQDICNFHDAHAVYASYGGIVFAADEGERIADALGDRNKGAILMNHGLLTVGATVDEAGFMFGLLDRGCRHQLQVEAAAANGHLKKNIISDEEAAYNFKMASEENALYREAQPDLEYEFAMAGGEEVLAKGFENLQFTSS